MPGMTIEDARAIAKQVWGSGAVVQCTFTALACEEPIGASYAVGVADENGLTMRARGEGRSWEHAFASAGIRIKTHGKTNGVNR